MSKTFFGVLSLVLTVGCDCGSGTFDPGEDGGQSDVNGGDGAGSGDGSDRRDGGAVPQFTELWYSGASKLIRVSIDASNGDVSSFVASDVTVVGGPTTTLKEGGCGITMLKEDGSLLISRQNRVTTDFYHVAAPPRQGEPVTAKYLGEMPDGILIEGLYTDCDGRVYGMDSGEDTTTADGNRLIYYDGDFLSGDLSYKVVSDLSSASVADIDDMGPGIDNNNVTDNPGIAIDTGTLHAFNYETGSGSPVASGGDWGVHVLGAPLFNDRRSRLYISSKNAEIYEVNPTNYMLSDVLGQGPDLGVQWRAPSGLAGPLTDCTSGFVTVD